MAAAEHQLTTDISPDEFSGLDLGPAQFWLNDPVFRKSQLFGEYVQRLVNGRDMNIIITAASETGVGKTTLAVALAYMMDQRGWSHEKACVADPIKYDRLYDQTQPGSVLILDEAEKAMDARQGQRKEAIELTQSFATKRYRQVFSILTAPSKSWVDKRLGGDASDYWIQCQEGRLGSIKGEALVYRLRENEHSNEPYSKFVEYLHWPPLDSVREFQKLDEEKVRTLETSQSGKTYYHTDEVDDMLDKQKREVKLKHRNRLIRDAAASTEHTQTELADIFGVSQGTISNVVNTN
jgi:hypothetical protein